MNLKWIISDPQHYQRRHSPYSEATVNAIVKEGIDLSKFDAIPLFQHGPAMETMPAFFCVAGDGHSRFEAILRLAKANRLPKAWRDREKGGWDIPCRIVDRDAAQKLAWTANMSRDNFTPCEEAGVFRDMMRAGLSLEEVAAMTQKTVVYIERALPLTVLCREIAARVGGHPDAAGIEKSVAQVMAEKFQRYGIDAAQQRELWHGVLKHTELTCKFVRALLDRIGSAVATRTREGLLFEMPANVSQVMAEMKDRAKMLRNAEYGLQYLLLSKSSGVLDGLPELKAILDSKGKEMIGHLHSLTVADAEILGSMFA